VIDAELRSEWMRARGRPPERYTAAVVIVLGVVIPIVMVSVSTRNARMWTAAMEALAFPASASAARVMAMLIGPVCAAAIGANVVGAEYQYGTWPWLLVRTSSRGRLLLVKIVVAAARIIGLTIVGILTFVAVGAVTCKLFGAPWTGDAITARLLLLPFIEVAGAMAFAAAIGFTVTVVSRSVVFGTLTGVLALPLLSAIRFKETAAWIPYVQLENLQSRLMNGQPSPIFLRLYELDVSARASAGIVSIELVVILVVAYLVFRRQEIVY
jgi:ABC-type transport system involved in multi-copper enzyme maturation permease subunit